MLAALDLSRRSNPLNGSLTHRVYRRPRYWLFTRELQQNSSRSPSSTQQRGAGQHASHLHDCGAFISLCTITLGGRDEDGGCSVAVSRSSLMAVPGKKEIQVTCGIDPQCRAVAGRTWVNDSDLFYGRQDVTDIGELFDYKYRRPFAKLPTSNLRPERQSCRN